MNLGEPVGKPVHLDDLESLKLLWSEGWDRLKNSHWGPMKLGYLTLWAVGLLGDAALTLTTLTHAAREVEEGNPLAAALMDYVGLAGWGAFSILAGLVFMVFSFGHPTTRPARLLWLMAVGLLVAKLAVVAANANVILQLG